MVGSRAKRWLGQRSTALGVTIFVSYLVPAVVAFWHIWASPAQRAMSYGAGDSAIYSWNLEWFPWAIAHGHNPFISHLANYPFGVNVLANTSLATLAMVGAPITAIWGPVVALNVWWTLAFPLSAGAGYLLARRFTDRRWAAWFGGLLYGFSPYMLGQGAGHLHLAFVPVPALIFLVLHDLVVRQDRSPRASGVRLAVLVVVQFFISSEVLATTVVFAALAVAVTAVAYRHEVRARLAHVLEGVVTAAVIAGVLLAYPVSVALAGPDHIHGAVVGYRYYYSALFAPLLPSSLLALGTHHLHALGNRIGGNGVENGTYLGAPLVVLIVVAPFVVRRRRVVLASLLVAAAAFVLSLGVTFHAGLVRFDGLDGRFKLPADLLYKLPLLDDAWPVRYSLYVDLFAAMGVAVVLDEIAGWARRSRVPAHAAGGGTLGRLRPAVPALLAVVVAIPLLPAWPYAGQGSTGVPAFFTSSAVKYVPAGSVALVYPYPTNTTSNAELWQAEAGFRFAMPGGYFILPSAHGPGSVFTADTLAERTFTAVLSGPLPVRTPALRRLLRAELGRWKVQTVIAQPVGNHPIGFLTWLVGRPPSQSVGGVDVWSATTWA